MLNCKGAEVYLVRCQDGQRYAEIMSPPNWVPPLPNEAWFDATYGDRFAVVVTLTPDFDLTDQNKPITITWSAGNVTLKVEAKVDEMKSSMQLRGYYREQIAFSRSLMNGTSCLGVCGLSFTGSHSTSYNPDLISMLPIDIGPIDSDLADLEDGGAITVEICRSNFFDTHPEITDYKKPNDLRQSALTQEHVGIDAARRTSLLNCKIVHRMMRWGHSVGGIVFELQFRALKPLPLLGNTAAREAAAANPVSMSYQRASDPAPRPQLSPATGNTKNAGAASNSSTPLGNPTAYHTPAFARAQQQQPTTQESERKRASFKSRLELLNMKKRKFDLDQEELELNRELLEMD